MTKNSTGAGRSGVSGVRGARLLDWTGGAPCARISLTRTCNLHVVTPRSTDSTVSWDRVVPAVFTTSVLR